MFILLVSEVSDSFVVVYSWARVSEHPHFLFSCLFIFCFHKQAEKDVTQSDYLDHVNKFVCQFHCFFLLFTCVLFFFYFLFVFLLFGVNKLVCLSLFGSNCYFVYVCVHFYSLLVKLFTFIV